MQSMLNERGSTTTRVLCALLGAASLLFGILLFVAGVIFVIVGFENSPEPLAVAIFMMMGVVFCIDGVLLFVLPAKLEALRAPLHQYNASQQPRSQPQPEPQPEPQPQAPEPSSPSAKKSAGKSTEETARMLLRSDNIFATAKDIIRTQRDSSSQAHRLAHLGTMLNALDLEAWESSPVCPVTKLSRTGNYWMRFNPGELEPADYDRFVATEAALNIDLALPDVADLPFNDPRATRSTLHYLRHFIEQERVTYDFGPSLGVAYPHVPIQNTPGEWLARTSIVNDAECVRVPFRLAYSLRSNAPAGIAILSMEIPRPACFAIVTGDKNQRCAYARAYALRVSWLLASHAFQSLDGLHRLEVLCHEHASAPTLLGISYTRELVERLRPIVLGTGIEGNGFPQDDAIVVTFNDDGWFAPVEPKVPFGSDLVTPQSWFVYPELDERTLSARAREITGSTHVRDLAINENGARVNAMDGLAARWSTLQERSCKNVVATLMDLRDSTTDVSIAEACERTAKALLDGTVDPADTQGIGKIFVSDGALQLAVEQAARLLNDDEHHNPEAAASILREVLDPIFTVGFYADDESYVYRYFGSTAERLVFNARLDDHAREVCLVPDSYYNALSLLASALIALGNNREAIGVANEMMRIAPASTDAIMRKVRALENDSRILEAAELIRERAVYAATPRDAALAHYRLAYMEWKLGREDLAAACYQRALTWDTPLAQQARSELDDLLESYENLQRSEPNEVAQALEVAGIPLGFTKADQDLMLTSATLLVDEHAFMVAHPLISVLCAAEGDDVLVSIRRSLEK